MNLEIFKAYDIRGIYPISINEEAAYNIAKGYSTLFKPKKVALGRDIRLSSEALFEATLKGFLEMGVDVVDVGIISTDMLYFAVSHLGLDGGITITGSHNSKEYNGMKLIKEKSQAVSGDSGIQEIRKIIENNEFSKAEGTGNVEQVNVLDEYVEKVLSFIEVDKVRPLKVVVNPNFGAGGMIIEKIAEKLKLDLVKLNFEPDGNFPKGSPNPMLPELRTETSELVKSSGADLGVSWDSDADRCFWFDEKGRFVDSYYEGLVLSKIFLDREKGSKIIHDPRLVWGAEREIPKWGGIPLVNKAGHAFIKERMRQEDAVFGFENSGHLFFRNFYYCDNGMIPFVMIVEEISKRSCKLSEVVDPIRFAYPISEEVNFRVSDPQKVIKILDEKYSDCQKFYIDGVSVDCGDVRFNVRPSNTEPLIRLNVEADTRELLDQKKAEIVAIIKQDLVTL